MTRDRRTTSHLMVPPSGVVTSTPVRRGGLATMLDRPDTFSDLVSPDLADTDFAAEWRLENRAKITDQFNEIVEINGFLKSRRMYPPMLLSSLYLTAYHQGIPHWLGLASLRVVTDTGVAFLVDAWQNIVELENQKFHGTGSGTTAESAAQTALVTEFTTETDPDSTRATGTTVEGASANIYRTVATNDYDATVAVTEHGIFDQAATGGGVMWDRSVFSAVNLVSGDSLQSAYELTVTSGS